MGATSELRNVRYLLVGDDVGKTTTDFPDSMNDGEIGIFDPYGNRYTEAGANQGDSFFLALYRGGSKSNPLVRTAVVNSSNINRATATVATASNGEQEQIDYIGWNASTGSGSIDALNDNHYIARVYIQEFLTSNSHGRRIEHAEYDSDSSATQEEVALGLSESFIYNVNHKNRAEEFMRFGAVNDAGTGVGLSGEFDGDLTVTKGSTKANAASLDVNAASFTAEAGDYIRIAEDPTTAVSISDHVYKIESINGNEITLDRPFRYPSATHPTGGTASHQVIQAANIGANWGIKLEARPLDFRLGELFYRKHRFVSDLDNGGSTNVANAQAAQEGQGMGEQIAEMEWFLQGNEGEIYKTPQPGIFQARQDTNLDYRYDLIDLEIERSESVNFGPELAPMTITLATPSSLSVGATPDYVNTGTAEDVTDVLEKLIYGTVNGNLAL